MTVVGFVGLGHMGGPMAANLVKAGVRVVGFDLASQALAAAEAAGVQIEGSAGAAVRAADVVITMVQKGSQVIGLYRDELLTAAPKDRLFVDCSTIDVADARRAAQLAVAAGHRAVDAPVSGGVAGAQGATLTFMVGGVDRDVAQARPLLEAMGRRVVHCGGNGVGQVAKICNNMVLAASMISIGEAFVLGEKLGLSAQAFYDVASAASGQCWSLTSYCPVPGIGPDSPADHDYAPGFAAALMNKDLGLAVAAIEGSGVAADLGRTAAEAYARFAAEHPGLDFSAIIGDIRARSGL
jgi:3-hydroxyisobutyrate dehydrogenase